MPTISIVSTAFNEEGNVAKFYEEITKVMSQLPDYDYELVIADNCSTDATVDILREISKKDKRVKVILNAKNFGAPRSQYNAILSTTGDAVIVIPADLQVPADIIPGLISKWEAGNEVVCATYKRAADRLFIRMLRKLYYYLMVHLSETPHIPNFTGIGLYDKRFIVALRSLKEPQPYLRGLVGEIGFKQTTHEYIKRPRTYGKSNFNFWGLYDVAITGIINHSKVPMRLTSFIGFAVAAFSLLCALVYFVVKLLWWDAFSIGIAPLVIGLFFIASINLIAIGILGEYVVVILAQTKNYPHVIERERINFSPTT